jgi:hypothetical protein
VEEGRKKVTWLDEKTPFRQSLEFDLNKFLKVMVDKQLNNLRIKHIIEVRGPSILSFIMNNTEIINMMRITFQSRILAVGRRAKINKLKGLILIRWRINNFLAY